MKGIYSELFAYVKKKKFTYVLLMVCLFTGILLDLALPWFMMNITDSALGGNTKEFRFILIIGILILLFTFAQNYFDVLIKNYIASFVRNNLRLRLFDHYLKLPMQFFSKTKSGENSSRIINDVNVVGDLMGNTLVSLIQGPLVAIAAFIFLINIQWQLALICGLIGPLIILIGKIFGVSMRRISGELQEQVSQSQSYIQETMNNMPFIRTYLIGNLVAEKFGGLTKKIFNYDLKKGKIQAALQGSSQAVGFLTFLIAFGLGAYFILIGEITIGALLAFIQLLNHVVWPFSGLAQVWGTTQESLSACERIFRVLKEKRQFTSLPEALTASSLESNHISVDKVSFSYDEGSKKILNDISLKVKENQFVAIVGHNGSGKSTIFKLLLGFFPYTGMIKINNKNTNEMTYAELMQYFSFVSQDQYLFSGTVLENIRYGNLQAKESDIKTLLKNLKFDDLMNHLPNGLATEVGEGGSGLSGGQRQKISIARAILRNAPIFLFDEATSALDYQSEEQIQEVLLNFKNERTTLVIAHKASTIKQADYIIVLDKGEIRAKGSHNELMNKDAYYRDLYKEYVVGDAG
ncbi:ABC transporter ATP-binding protein [Oceanobacillus neutriphilus]|uniref:ABC transporter ATP-binding protein n=1 Tax=Oceanobacillus neutriphilus TaxID=531815 RepID=A0ABQ2NR35_9BACI|nr:ABC transporter ATP-binding protein [Oceanobacillus neutriphilus]GGP08362.1 ABC transporter ATP-binding protein [Oceanobacillus neutriphilus]